MTSLLAIFTSPRGNISGCERCDYFKLAVSITTVFYQQCFFFFFSSSCALYYFSTKDNILYDAERFLWKFFIFLRLRRTLLHKKIFLISLLARWRPRLDTWELGNLYACRDSAWCGASFFLLLLLGSFCCDCDSRLLVGSVTFPFSRYLF